MKKEVFLVKLVDGKEIQRLVKSNYIVAKEEGEFWIFNMRNTDGKVRTFVIENK